MECEGGAGGADELRRLAVVGYEFVYEGQCGDCENAHQHGGDSSVLLALWNWCVRWNCFHFLFVSRVFGLSCRSSWFRFVLWYAVFWIVIVLLSVFL